jgi:hypothetical protein
MRWTFVTFALITAIGCSLSGCGPSGPRNGFYQRIRIGPDGKIAPEGERTLYEPAVLNFFDYFSGSYVLSIEHRVRPVQGAPAQKAFYLEAKETNARLDRTVKTSELLHGEFGSISLEKTCFYNRSFDVNLDTVAIGLHDGRSEPAKLVNPPTAQKIPTSFALLRVFRDGDGAAVVSGGYEANGTLRSLHVNHTRSGARLFYQEDGIFMYPLSSQMASAPNPIGVGLPLVLESGSKGFMRLPVTSFPVTAEALFTVYADGLLVREDVLAEGRNGLSALKETRYLQPSVVDEQRQLDPACNAQLAKQRTAQKRTVE